MYISLRRKETWRNFGNVSRKSYICRLAFRGHLSRFRVVRLLQRGEMDHPVRRVSEGYARPVFLRPSSSSSSLYEMSSFSLSSRGTAVKWNCGTRMRVASCLCRAHREESRAPRSAPRRVLGLRERSARGWGQQERRARLEWGERDARRCAPAVNG